MRLYSSCALAAPLVVCLLMPIPGKAQDCKGQFIDGECREDYVYVPDFMTPQELKKNIDEKAKDIVIVDTAAPAIWEDEHIPGAVNFPYSKEVTAPVPLPREKTLVVYCACKDDEDSKDVARQLSLIGYRKVKVLEGGWFKWLDLKYETVGKTAPAPAPSAAIVSGPAVGGTTMSIPVMDVTGQYKGQLVCYVCDYDKAPDVLGFFRDTSDDTAKEIIQLNELYLKNKSRGFKAVAMIVAGESAKPWLEELSRSAHLEIPLTYFRKGPKDAAARAYNLNPAVGNTFLVTVDRTVVANISDISPDQFSRVADATSQMLAKLN